MGDDNISEDSKDDIRVMIILVRIARVAYG